MGAKDEKGTATCLENLMCSLVILVNCNLHIGLLIIVQLFLPTDVTKLARSLLPTIDFPL